MTVTPRATPVVKSPLQSVPASERVSRNQLRAPIVVVATVGEWELESGELIIGRDPSANIVLEDSLVSRFHARIVVADDGKVMLEDLQSANGVFINGVKNSRQSRILGEGDRLLIGTTEISVFELRSSAMVRQGKLTARMPLANPMRFSQGNPKVQTSDESRLPPKRPVVVTTRTDAINLVGQCAEQLMDSGHPLEAVRVLTEHLQNLMKGASAGLSVPTRILESATRYALRLRSWTQRASWISYVFELHLASLQVPSEACLGELEAALYVTNDLDVESLGYFIKTIERRPEPLTADETLRLQRIERLCEAKSSKPAPYNA